MPYPSNLHLFCECIVKKYKNPGQASEEQKADEFQRMFFRNMRLSMKTLSAVSTTCGIKLDGLDEERMPGKLRGYHEVYKNRRHIYFRKDDTVSGTMNTILHEMREMMENVFVEICPSYHPLRTSARHLAANRFATAVLLPHKSFTPKIYETGFDIIELANHFEKSCPQVLLRVGEVLQGKLFFYGAIYEPDDEEEWRVTYWTGCRNDLDPDANVYGIDRILPRKGHESSPGSLVDLTVKTGKPHLVEHITFLDERDDDGLIAITNPFMIHDIPVKVILIAMIAQDRELLNAQIERMNPLSVEGFHRHL